jgi:uncharacterized protein
VTQRRWLGVVGWLAGGAAAAVGGAIAFQRHLMYPAPRTKAEPAIAGATLHRITGSGRTVYAIHVPARAGSPTIVHFHGNAETLADQGAYSAALADRGFGFFAVEYPGYGLSRSNSPSEQAIYEDADTALRYLASELATPAQSTVLSGRSLGTGVAVEMAQRGFGSRLVLISPFTSMTDMARHIARFLPAKWIVRDQYDSHGKAAKLTLPVLIVHGSDDEIIPVAMSRRLATVFPDSRLYIAPGARHNDLFEVDGQRIVDAITAFANGEPVLM